MSSTQCQTNRIGNILENSHGFVGLFLRGKHFAILYHQFIKKYSHEEATAGIHVMNNQVISHLLLIEVPMTFC